MITARRSDGFTSNEKARGGVDLLERTPARDAEETPARTESMEEAKARMQRNLDRLLNYDRYSEIESDKADVIEETAATEEKTRIRDYSDEDIRPTTTTTQFIDGDPQIFNDAEKSKEQRRGAYKLNAKGKLVVTLYALVVTVILALIVLNTGVLKSLSKEVAALNETYKAEASLVAAQVSEISEISSPEHIIPLAEDFGMVLR